jgi:hypothetical protein
VRDETASVVGNVTVEEKGWRENVGHLFLAHAEKRVATTTLS